MNVDYQLWDPLSPVLRLFETKGWSTFNHEVVSWVLFLSFCVQLFNNTSSWLVVWRTIVTIFVKQLLNNQSLSKALVSSVVFTKKNTEVWGQKKPYIQSQNILPFSGGAFPMTYDPFLQVLRECVQPFRVYTAHFKIVLTLQVYDRWHFLLLSYFKSVLSRDTYTVVWLDEACPQTAPLWLPAAAGRGQSQEQEQGPGCAAAGTAPQADQISCRSWTDAGCWEADVTGMVLTGKVLPKLKKSSF